MVKLSVNINKIATLRNARGGNNPDLLKMANDIQSFGADGITIHPRPDQRHITYNDAIELPSVVHKEYNIEGNPIDKFIKLVLSIKPDQVTLVPDSIDAITSNSGWDTIKNKNMDSQSKVSSVYSELFEGKWAAHSSSSEPKYMSNKPSGAAIVTRLLSRSINLINCF